MDTCGQNLDRIWDLLYGLLDARESAAVREHLDQCQLCQAAWNEARVGQILLAEAAQLDIEVPVFVAPVDEPAPTIVMRIASDKKPARRLWPWIAAAAAILFLIGLPWGFYGYQLHQRELDLELANGELAEVTGQYKDAFDRVQSKDARLADEQRTRLVHLQVFGPDSLQVGATQSYGIVATDLNGKAVPTEVSAQLMDANQRPVAETSGAVARNGAILTLGIPRTFLGQWGRLEVVARGADDRQLVREELKTVEPGLVTRLEVPKAVFRPGETIPFRSVTLDRLFWRPVPKPLTLTLILSGPLPFVPQVARRPVEAGGVCSGEMKLPADVPEGEYTLHAEVQGRGSVANRRLLVRRPVRTPAVAPVSPGKNATPSVQFFPEGGRQIAGVSNRIYFEARGADGRPIDLEGRVVDRRRITVAEIHTTPHTAEAAAVTGLGSFMLTPQAGEEYGLFITKPGGAAAPRMLPSVQPEGTTLGVKAGVIRAEEPLEVILQHQGQEQEIVVVLYCRGRVVAQEIRRVRRGRTEMALTPPRDCAGVLRVAVFDADPGQLQPIAERWVYRMPSSALKLETRIERANTPQGSRITGHVSCVDGKGQGVPAWLLVSVVDDSVVRQADDPGERSLASYFQVASSFDRPEEIPDLFLNSRPGVEQALDLYLGTQRPPLPSKNEQRTDVAIKAQGLLKIDNHLAVQRQWASAVAQAKFSLATDWAREDAVWREQENLRRERAQQAAQNLMALSTRAGDFVRLGAGMTALVLFFTALVLLLIPVGRLLRGGPVPRVYFAGAASLLLLCLGVFQAPLEHWLGADRPASTIAGNSLALDFRPTPAPEMPARPLPPKKEQPRAILPFRPSGTSTWDPTAIRYHPEQAGAVEQETLLWLPLTAAANGQAEFSFGLPAVSTGCRIRIEGHTASGEFGFAQESLRK